MNNPLKNVSFAGKAFIAVCIVALLWGGSWVYRKAFPEKVKKAEIKTKVTSLPPLAYDKASNATFRPLPSFNEPADVQAAEMRGAIMGWNAFCGANYAVGGTSTSVGSIAQELGLNIRLAVQNSCSKQGDELYAFAQELHDGVPNPTKGVPGNVSKVDFTSKQKGDVIGDASYSIQFNLGSDVIKPESYTVLEKVIGQLAATNDAFIEINGHTDVTGDDVSNMELSKKRAASVLKYLISKGEAGLDARASSNGYGETKPLPGVLPTDARNRRVEIKVFRSK